MIPKHAKEEIPIENYEAGKTWDPSVLKDPNHPIFDRAIRNFKKDLEEVERAHQVMREQGKQVDKLIANLAKEYLRFEHMTGAGMGKEVFDSDYVSDLSMKIRLALVDFPTDEYFADTED